MIPSHALVALVPFFLSYTLATPIDHGLVGASDVTAEDEVVNDITTVQRKPYLKQCRAWKYEDQMVHYCLASKDEHPSGGVRAEAYELKPRLISFDILHEASTAGDGDDQRSVASEFIPIHEKHAVLQAGFDQPDTNDHKQWLTPEELYLDEAPSKHSNSPAAEIEREPQHDGCKTCWIADGWVMEYQGDYIISHPMHRAGMWKDSTGLWRKKFYARIQVCIDEKDGDDMDLGQFKFVEAVPEDILGHKYKKKSDLRGHLFFRQTFSDTVRFCPVGGDDPITDDVAFDLALAAEEEDRAHGFIRGEKYNPSGERLLIGSRRSKAVDHHEGDLNANVASDKGNTGSSSASGTKQESGAFDSPGSSKAASNKDGSVALGVGQEGKTTVEPPGVEDAAGSPSTTFEGSLRKDADVGSAAKSQSLQEKGNQPTSGVSKEKSEPVYGTQLAPPKYDGKFGFTHDGTFNPDEIAAGYEEPSTESKPKTDLKTQPQPEQFYGAQWAPPKYDGKFGWTHDGTFNPDGVISGYVEPSTGSETKTDLRQESQQAYGAQLAPPKYDGKFGFTHDGTFNPDDIAAGYEEPSTGFPSSESAKAQQQQNLDSTSLKPAVSENAFRPATGPMKVGPKSSEGKAVNQNAPMQQVVPAKFSTAPEELKLGRQGPKGPIVANSDAGANSQHIRSPSSTPAWDPALNVEMRKPHALPQGYGDLWQPAPGYPPIRGYSASQERPGMKYEGLIPAQQVSSQRYESRQKDSGDAYGSGNPSGRTNAYNTYGDFSSADKSAPRLATIDAHLLEDMIHVIEHDHELLKSLALSKEHPAVEHTENKRKPENAESHRRGREMEGFRPYGPRPMRFHDQDRETGQRDNYDAHGYYPHFASGHGAYGLRHVEPLKNDDSTHTHSPGPIDQARSKSGVGAEKERNVKASHLAPKGVEGQGQTGDAHLKNAEHPGKQSSQAALSTENHNSGDLQAEKQNTHQAKPNQKAVSEQQDKGASSGKLKSKKGQDDSDSSTQPSEEPITPTAAAGDSESTESRKKTRQEKKASRKKHNKHHDKKVKGDNAAKEQAVAAEDEENYSNDANDGEDFGSPDQYDAELEEGMGEDEPDYSEESSDSFDNSNGVEDKGEQKSDSKGKQSQNDVSSEDSGSDGDVSQGEGHARIEKRSSSHHEESGQEPDEHTEAGDDEEVVIVTVYEEEENENEDASGDEYYNDEEVVFVSIEQEDNHQDTRIVDSHVMKSRTSGGSKEAVREIIDVQTKNGETEDSKESEARGENDHDHVDDVASGTIAGDDHQSDANASTDKGEKETSGAETFTMRKRLRHPHKAPKKPNAGRIISDTIYEAYIPNLPVDPRPYIGDDMGVDWLRYPTASADGAVHSAHANEPSPRHRSHAPFQTTVTVKKAMGDSSWVTARPVPKQFTRTFKSAYPSSTPSVVRHIYDNLLGGFQNF
ncbi:hypothetical protein BJ508DRAFT_301890 [Ascobolus immersus RN42]|uniref:Uncharacterized protein n=1 Tax=Ascobolus immersus RN42 TaxID=1160509 RepID=A0A3N4IM86_ASCIM|nr:hypothetical protein BJ508DRAFT_301890 [Ascobolus immersus RN42]